MPGVLAGPVLLPKIEGILNVSHLQGCIVGRGTFLMWCFSPASQECGRCRSNFECEMLWTKVLGFARRVSGRELKAAGEQGPFRVKLVRDNGDESLTIYHENWKKNGIVLQKWCFCQPYVRLLRSGNPVTPASVNRVDESIGHKSFPWVTAVFIASGIVGLGLGGLEIKTRLCFRCNRRFPEFLGDCPSCSPPW